MSEFMHGTAIEVTRGEVAAIVRFLIGDLPLKFPDLAFGSLGRVRVTITIGWGAAIPIDIRAVVVACAIGVEHVISAHILRVVGGTLWANSAVVFEAWCLT